MEQRWACATCLARCGVPRKGCEARTTSEGLEVLRWEDQRRVETIEEGDTEGGRKEGRQPTEQLAEDTANRPHINGVGVGKVLDNFRGAVPARDHVRGKGGRGGCDAGAGGGDPGGGGHKSRAVVGLGLVRFFVFACNVVRPGSRRLGRC